MPPREKQLGRVTVVQGNTTTIQWVIPRGSNCKEDLISPNIQTNAFNAHFIGHFGGKDEKKIGIGFSIDTSKNKGSNDPTTFQLFIEGSPNSTTSATADLTDSGVPIQFTLPNSLGSIRSSKKNITFTLVYQTGTTIEEDPVQEQPNQNLSKAHLGIINQGATCYLNSFIQTLFHLPIFRKLIYSMATTGDEGPNCIPLALQRLFIQLQSDNKPPSTRDLTISFGWTHHESFVQSDIQEFARVLLDNLNEKLVGTENESVINDILQGRLSNYIKCINVAFDKTTEEPFYDLSLVVRGCKTLDESFEQYTTKNILDGDNKYQTEEYGLQDAYIGTEFVSFPPILQIHLRRFEFDFETMSRKKVLDAFAYPSILDLTRYGRPNDIFELFGVLVHQGNSTGGHYFAYLRTSQQKQWYQFNDAYVYEVTEKEVLNGCFGSPKTPYGPTAYMLQYVRQCDIGRIYCEIADEIIPNHLKEFAEVQKAKPIPIPSRSRDSFEIMVYTEEGLFENARNNRTGFLATQHRKVKISKDTKQSELYELLKAELGLNYLRIWTMKNSSTLSVPISETGTSKISVFEKTIFVESEAHGEIPRNSILLFIYFFLPDLDAPLQFICTRTVSIKLTPSIIGRDLSSILHVPEKAVYKVFLERSNRIVELKPTESLENTTRDNGTMLIFQLTSNHHPIFPFKEPLNPTTREDQSYSTVVTASSLVTYKQFKEGHAGYILIHIFDYTHTTKLLHKLKVRPTTKVSEVLVHIHSEEGSLFAKSVNGYYAADFPLSNDKNFEHLRILLNASKVQCFYLLPHAFSEGDRTITVVVRPLNDTLKIVVHANEQLFGQILHKVTEHLDVTGLVAFGERDYVIQKALSEDFRITSLSSLIFDTPKEDGTPVSVCFCSRDFVPEGLPVLVTLAENDTIEEAAVKISEQTEKPSALVKQMQFRVAFSPTDAKTVPSLAPHDIIKIPSIGMNRGLFLISNAKPVASTEHRVIEEAIHIRN